MFSKYREIKAERRRAKGEGAKGKGRRAKGEGQGAKGKTDYMLYSLRSLMLYALCKKMA
ncbi:MAG: hypothetical protein MZV63_30950 [Marinilabiliales bacterium]|nr:hypothetical protein [Marinilabiliales bacterium]